MVRLVVAPLAVLSVGGLAAGVLWLGPAGTETTEAVQAPRAVADLGVSRSQARPALSPSASPSQEPLDLEAAKAANPEVVTPEPTVSPSAPATPASPAPEQASAVSGTAASGEVAAAGGVAAEAEGSAEAAVEAPAEPAVDYSALSDAAGSLFASASVNVRTGPGTDFEVLDSLAAGAEVAVTAWEADGWRQVSVDDAAGWVKASFLAESKPAVAAAAESSSGFSTAACEKAAGLERNLTDRTVGVLRAVCAEFPAVDSYGGYRPGDNDSYHGSGQAIDVMVSGEYGWEVARWARANASALGIIEVIYEQQIWTTQRAGDGWRGMSDRGSVSANHYDHVHISVR
ncbi:hypothetical protein GCM10025789_19560 [Tessaracoccus lubricantis]|uniref:SH3b domain-containing protein n=4 Tax=Tessaracoccus lubricantis TaxID=545543 RepID=A0ABP9FP88_9ACTN